MKKHVGTSPVSLFLERSIILIAVMLHSDGGILPEMMLSEASKTTNLGNNKLILVGSCPSKWFIDMLMIRSSELCCHIESNDPTSELLAMFR